MFVKRMRKLKIDLKMGFINTDGASNGKHQLKFTSMEKNIIIEIYTDPNEFVTDGESERTEEKILMT